MCHSCSVALLVQATEGSLLPGPYLTLGDFVLSVGSGERLGSSVRGLDPCGCCLSHSQAPLWKGLLLPALSPIMLKSPCTALFLSNVLPSL